MTKKELEQLRALHQEIETLEERYILTPPEECGDTYGDYSHGFKQIKVLQGLSTARADRIRDRITKKYEQLTAKVDDMEEWLDDVEDSEMRDILRLYYANGLNQEEIARRKGYTRSAIAMKLKKYWDEL